MTRADKILELSVKIEEIKKRLPCQIIYYPGSEQIELFINVNDTPVRFVYDEQDIIFQGIETIMMRIDDDLFLAGNRINKGEYNI